MLVTGPVTLIMWVFEPEDTASSAKRESASAAEDVIFALEDEVVVWELCKPESSISVYKK